MLSCRLCFVQRWVLTGHDTEQLLHERVQGTAAKSNAPPSLPHANIQHKPYPNTSYQQLRESVPYWWALTGTSEQLWLPMLAFPSSLCVMVTSSDLLMCTNDRGDIMQAQPVAAIEDPQICGYQLYHDCSKSETAPLQAWRLAYVYAFNLVGKQ